MSDVTAILAIRNEAAMLATCLSHLVRNGLRVALIDHGSTDGSAEIYGAPEFAPHIADVRRQPFEGVFSLQAQLEAKQAMAEAIGGDWVVYVDADEMMHSYRPDETLADALRGLGAAGWNAANFDEFVFLPVEHDYAPCTDGFPDLGRYYFYEPSFPRLVRAWRQGAGLAMRTRAHRPDGETLRLAPESLALRHYMFRSQAHAYEKYPGRAYSESELRRGWHAQRAGQPPRNYRFPSAQRLKRLARADDVGLDRSEPWSAHYWRQPPLAGRVLALARSLVASDPPQPAEAAPGPPVAIGGIGGSGTRVGAELLRVLGMYVGCDLNEASDNLWFTLLFKEPGVLDLPEPEFAARCALFWARMSGDRPLTGEERALATAVAARPHFRHRPEWLGQRAASLAQDGLEPGPRPAWGWKEPNTALVAGRLLDHDPSLRYIHFVRHPFDMARSLNQNQLANWGPALLGPRAATSAVGAVAFWCEANRRFRAVERRFPGRTLTVRYEDLCADPARVARQIAALAGRELAASRIAWFERLVRRGRTRGRRGATLDAAALDPDDAAYIAALGYEV